MNDTSDVGSAPRIVGIGGTKRAGSSSVFALQIALNTAAAAGARVALLTGADIDFAVYDPASRERGALVHRFIEELRTADGVIIASPAYHAGLSGMVKNALDYIEDLRQDARPYLDGRAVGCIVTAAGWQGAVMTLNSLRSVVHALRGWPTPLGVAINTSDAVFEQDGHCRAPAVQAQLQAVAHQVLTFARASLAAATARQRR